MALLDPTTSSAVAAPAASADEPLVLGVCTALAARFGASTAVVRAAAVILGVAGGLGMVAYLATAALWRHRPGRVVPWSAAHDAGVLLLAGGAVWEASYWWPGLRAALIAPVALVAIGVALGWRRPSRPTPTAAVARVAAGAVLCIAGLAVFLGQRVDVATLRDTSLAVAVAIGGVAVVLGPTAVRMARSVGEERAQRIRAQERAAVAAHLHDSVLQTLTLIQKRADDPAAAVALARHEERSLRRWLYGDGPTPDACGWREEVERIVGEVEDRHGIAVDLVMVGDGPSTPAVAAVLAAAREALVNAAKFSGEARVSMYCEWSDDQFSTFVRDRGCGFDPAAVDPDRRGLRDSVTGRVRGVGGHVTVRSTPGEGTEVVLTVRAPR